MDIEQSYFNLLKEISGEVHIFIDSQIKEAGDLATTELFTTLQDLPEKRREKNILRALLTKLVFASLTNTTSHKNLIPLCALSELNNYNAYLDNWILDNKNNVWGSEKAREKIGYLTIVSGLYRELIEKIIIKLDTSNDQKLLISEILSKGMTYSYIGQAQDMKMSTDTLRTYRSDEEYINAYVEKSLLQSGYLYGASAELGAVLADTDEKSRSLAREIGETIGTGLHISNDLGDFAIIQEKGDFKSYQDQMADLRNGRLTLPIYYVLRYGSESEQDIFMQSIGNEMTEKNSILVLNTLHSSGAYSYCKKFIRRYYNKAKRLIQQLPESQERDLLNYMTVVIRNNKYLANLVKK